MSQAVAIRYAAALADVAFERKNWDEVRSDLSSFVEAYFRLADLRNFLESPEISSEAKRRAIGQIAAQSKISSAATNFLYLVIDHHRTELLGEIQRAFESEMNARLGVAEAEVISAAPLSDAEKSELTAALECRTGKRIQARFGDDRALVGGAVVRVGSTIYDGSVRERLNRLREKLEEE